MCRGGSLPVQAFGYRAVDPSRRDRAHSSAVVIKLQVMRIISIALTLALVSGVIAAQAPGKTARSAASKPAGTLAQVMRGIYLLNANLIFDVQQHDPAAPKKQSNASGGSA